MIIFISFIFLGKNVFGVPLSVNVQRTGYALPKPILCAISYLRRTGSLILIRYYIPFLEIRE